MGVATPLWAAIEALVDWQERNKGRTAHRCLEAVRFGLRKGGMELPLSNVNYKGALAISCGARLAKDPARWGWRFVGKSRGKLPTNQPCLIFFRDCGRLDDGRVAGHVAIYKPSTNRHIANETHDMSAWWLERIAFIFVPE